MSQVINEGRAALKGLRSSDSGFQNLVQSLSAVKQELALPDVVDFRLAVEGDARPLRPIIGEEVYRIGREALVNAFRHSRASKIELEIGYAVKHLRIVVRDNGCGIDSEVLRSGRDGHWGIRGMREKAEEIGARLKVRSRPGAGTDVELSIPGDVAFEIRPSVTRWRRLAGLSRPTRKP